MIIAITDHKRRRRLAQKLVDKHESVFFCSLLLAWDSSNGLSSKSKRSKSIKWKGKIALVTKHDIETNDNKQGKKLAILPLLNTGRIQKKYYNHNRIEIRILFSYCSCILVSPFSLFYMWYLATAITDLLLPFSVVKPKLSNGSKKGCHEKQSKLHVINNKRFRFNLPLQSSITLFPISLP